MKVTELKNGKFRLISDGSDVENIAVSVLIEMLSHCNLPDDEFNNSFGIHEVGKFQKGEIKNYIDIPSNEWREKLLKQYEQEEK